MKKLGGKFTSNTITSLNLGGNNITDPSEIIEELSKSFAKITSFDNYRNPFREKIIRENLSDLEIPIDDGAAYNCPFSIIELQLALAECSGTSPGVDEIHYDMIKNATSEGKIKLLQLFNRIWETGDIPEMWKKTIPLAKPWKDPRDVNSYRKIQLSNCPCKLFERMVNKRLIWYLEGNRLLHNGQSGFRRYRGTSDSLLMLEGEIMQAFQNGEYVVAVSFDLSKAYDVTWRKNIIEKMLEMGLKGNMVKFIQNFMKSRKTSTAMGNHTSKEREQETGLIQGSVLSVTLFLIAINEILGVGNEEIKRILYADDLTIYLRGKDLEKIIKKLQKTIDE